MNTENKRRAVKLAERKIVSIDYIPANKTSNFIKTHEFEVQSTRFFGLISCVKKLPAGVYYMTTNSKDEACHKLSGYFDINTIDNDPDYKLCADGFIYTKAQVRVVYTEEDCGCSDRCNTATLRFNSAEEAIAKYEALCKEHGLTDDNLYQ